MKHTMKSSRVALALHTLIFSACLMGASSAFALVPGHLWSQRFGGTSDDYGLSAAVDGSGNVVVTGRFVGTANFGGGNLVSSAGSPDIFVAKYDANGVHQWSQRFGNTLDDYGQCVAVDGSGNVFVTGYCRLTVNFGGGDLAAPGNDADVFIAKFNANGVHQWSQRFGSGSGNDFGLSVAADGSGNVLLTGTFQGTVDFGGGNLVCVGGMDDFLAKYSATGVHQWSKRMGSSTGFDASYAVGTDGSGNVVVAGFFQGTGDFGGGNLVSAGGDDIFIAKFNASGVHQWSERFGGAASDDDAYGMATDESGNVLVTGRFGGTTNLGGSNLVCTGGTDIFVVKYNSNGVHQWSQRFGGTGYDQGWSARFDASGNAFVTGWFQGTANFGGGDLVSAGGNDIHIAEFNASGVHQWSQRFGSTGDDRGYSVALDGTGNLRAVGDFQGTVNFGGSDLVSTGGTDIFLVKLGQNPVQPLIAAIADIGNDQGKRVKIRFDGSSLDAASSPTPILRYVAFRRDSPAPPEMSSPGSSGVAARARLDVGWTEVASVHAFGRNSYGIDVPTLGDSTLAHGQYYSVFFIRAATAVPTTFYDSPPDSGYSLDNLAPGIPGSLAYSSGVLSWKKSTAGDFDHYTVYGASDRCFCTATLIDECVVPSMDVSLSPYEYYFVTAIDASGNEGTPAVVNALTGIGGTPTSYVLSVSAYPNPFNPTTTIRYTVPSKGDVEVSVFDARGAHVATLMNGEKIAGAYTQRWNGRDKAGQAVSSGVYFARVTHSSGTRTYKMVLLK